MLVAFGLGGKPAIVRPIQWGSKLWVEESGTAYVEVDGHTQTAASYLHTLQDPCRKTGQDILDQLQPLAKKTSTEARDPHQTRPNAKQAVSNRGKVDALERRLAAVLGGQTCDVDPGVGTGGGTTGGGAGAAVGGAGAARGAAGVGGSGAPGMDGGGAPGGGVDACSLDDTGSGGAGSGGAKRRASYGKCPSKCELAESQGKLHVDKRFDVTGAAGTFKVRIDYFDGRKTPGGNRSRRVCRVRSIDGPITKKGRTTTGTAEDTMRNLLLRGANEDKYDAGHLIADSLGGPNKPENLVPMNKHLNRKSPRDYGKMEDWIKTCLPSSAGTTSGCGVTEGLMSVKVTYDDKRKGDGRFIPIIFLVKVLFATADQHKSGQHSFTFNNDPPGPRFVEPNSCI